MLSEYSAAIAVLTVRLVGGILFFFQGYDKIFSVGIFKIKETMSLSTQSWKIPMPFISFIAYFTSWVELIAGFLLFVGFFKIYAIALLCINLILVSFGFSLAKPMWDTAHVMTRLIILIFLLLIPADWDIFSFDYLFMRSELFVSQ